MNNKINLIKVLYSQGKTIIILPQKTTQDHPVVVLGSEPGRRSGP